MNQQDTLVVFDTCVLLKPRLSDVLMDLRAEKLFSAHWNATIDDEYLRNMQKVFGVHAAAADARLKAMKRRCPEWEVPMACCDASAVPTQVDAHDAHVAATALALRRYADEPEEGGDKSGGVKVYILTENVKHMGQVPMRALGVEVMRPGRFLDLVCGAHPDETGRAVSRSVRDLQRPPYTQGELLWALKVQGATSLVAILAEAWGVVPVKKELAAPAALSLATDGGIPKQVKGAEPAWIVVRSKVRGR